MDIFAAVPLTLIVSIVLLVVVVIILINIYGRLLRKVGPNQALIVYGRGNMDVVTGGSKLVIPLTQRADVFSLELMSFDVAPSQDLYTTQGVAVNVEAVTQIKVRSDDESVKTAAEQFLSKSQQEREGLIRLGMEVISFTIKDVRDKNEYITNMGRPQIAEIKKQADIATAMAQRDTQIQQANASREASVAKAAADQVRVKAETESLALQAESQRNLSLKKAAFDAEVKKQQATADKTYDIQANLMQQQVVTEAVKVTEVEKNAQIKVQQAEIQRRELELEATIQKSAEAERRRIETVAGAERQRLILEAQGQADAAKTRGLGDADANRARGLAEAEVIRAKGLAEAEVIRAKGEAEADAMKVKAAAFHEYNQAAVLDKLLTGMPEMVRAIAEPLSKVDGITIVSTGSNGSDGLGASRLTNDITNIAAQVPALFELLSGTRISDLMKRVPGLSGQEVEGSASPDGAKT